MKPIIAQLQDAIGVDKVLSSTDQLNQRYNHIWTMHKPLIALGLVLPDCTEDVSKVLKICNDFKQRVVVFGGLTNLVGATETSAEELVISLERMNKIEEIDEQSRTITVQAGVILEQVHIAASDNDLMFPLNYGAKGSAQIGGALSTNAGGLRVLRYGMARNLVLGLEVVLADGTIMTSLKKIIKDNSGYDLKQLFIGAEGTLGVITRAVLKLVESPKSRTSAFVAMDDYQQVVKFLKYIDCGLAGTLSAYELIWGHTYQAMTSAPALVKPPIPHGYKYYVLIEGQGGDQLSDQERIEYLLQTALEQELILDGAMADGSSDMEWFWKIREDVHVLASQCDHDQHFDISLPISHIGDYVDETIELLLSMKEVTRAFSFGHIADGNIHFIVGKIEQSEVIIKKINDVIYRDLKSLGGSVSAEHGIGIHKKAYLNISKSQEEIAIMQLLKKTFDKNKILNYGKVIDC